MKNVEIIVHITQKHIWKWRCPYMGSNGVWLSSSEKVWYCAKQNLTERSVF